MHIHTIPEKRIFKCYHLSHRLRFKFQHVHCIFSLPFTLLSPQSILFFTCRKKYNSESEVVWWRRLGLVVAVKATGHNTYFIFYNFLLHLTNTRSTQLKTLYVCANVYIHMHIYCMYIFFCYMGFIRLDRVI